jgi:large subunit ribosomal protein L30
MSAQAETKRILVKWIKSTNGAKAPQRRTIKALGLHRLQNEVVKDASPQILGMVHSVRHLVQVTEVE